MNVRGLMGLLCIAVLTISTGCHRLDNSQGFNYTFQNFTDKQLNVTIYATQDDYNNNAHPLMSNSIKVRGYWVIPLSKFTTSHLYYVDIYTDDFLYNNWFWNNVTLRDTFLPSKDDYTFIIDHGQYTDPSRTIWLNGIGTSTTWKAFNSYTYNGSTYTTNWSSLTSAQQAVQIVISKSSFAHITTGTGTDTSIKFTAFYDGSLSRISLLNTDHSSLGTFTSNFNAATTAFNGGKDTMLAYISGVGYYAMARQ
ncbi:MAG: hypothetical protein H0X33_07205 [Taibaiella sp.]|nr:hypothetical protein [Taibaiella sp.]